MRMNAFNPLDMENLAASIVDQLTRMDAIPLTQLQKFSGAGIYAIYYNGTFPAYAELAQRNQGICTAPIYIGKAIPSGGRRGIAVEKETTALFKRLSEHSKSLDQAENILLSDFSARWLVMENIWIPLGESAMIRRHQPVWNALVDGFGNHDPGKGRMRGMRSKWDTIHPGRTWASKFPPHKETAAQVEQEIIEYLRSRLN